jgi:hypothetical protein
VFASYGFKARKFSGMIAASSHGRNGERAGIRTLDPVIKSHVLYQLSYALAKGISYLIPQPFASLAGLFVRTLLTCLPAG